MKNLLIYLNPSKDFDEEHKAYAKIQIDNSLQYWQKEDILLVTNFPYQYHGIKAFEVPDNLFCEFDAKASKINVIIYLLEKGVINETTWFHDFEAWQVGSINNLKLKKDLGLTDYGWKPKWNTGSFFFKPSALDVFVLLRDEVYKRKANEEPVLWILTKYNVNNINSRYQRLNITYNIGKRNVKQNLDIANKPIKVLHFHPYRENLLTKFESLLPNNLKLLMNQNSIYNLK